MNFAELFTKTGLIGAHRGARSVAPENTLRSLKASAGHCDFIEVDVQLSSDGVAVVMHDDTLERTTNVREIKAYKSRSPYNLCDFTLKELASLDYGSWFDGVFEPLLTLREALRFIKENKIFLNIEIKDMHRFFSDEKVVSSVLGEVKELRLEESVMFSSFRHEYLPLCKEGLPDILTAALVEDAHPDNLLEYLRTLHVDAYNMDDGLADRDTVRQLRDAGFFVNVYTVNDPLRAKELFEMGVNGIFTDLPSLLHVGSDFSRYSEY